jgi:hypothetical protein
LVNSEVRVTGTASSCPTNEYSDTTLPPVAVVDTAWRNGTALVKL